MAKLIIFGNGVIGELAEYYFRNDSEHEVVAFTADEKYITSDTFCGLPVLGFKNIVLSHPPTDYKMFIALSYVEMNKIRAKKYNEAKNLGYDLVSYISSRCTFLTDNPVGDNCFILEDNTIQPFVKIGNNIILWSGNHIGHESVIGDHCYVASHVVISGHVHIHPYCFIGVNASVRDNITISQESLIGAGAVIMNDTIKKGVYLPPRATLIDKKSDEMNL